MYDAWTAEQRQAIMWSIINLGLRFGVNVYTQAAGASGYSWWTAVDGNWNCVREPDKPKLNRISHGMNRN